MKQIEKAVGEMLALLEQNSAATSKAKADRAKVIEAGAVNPTAAEKFAAASSMIALAAEIDNSLDPRALSTVHQCDREIAAESDRLQSLHEDIKRALAFTIIEEVPEHLRAGFDATKTPRYKEEVEAQRTLGNMSSIVLDQRPPRSRLQDALRTVAQNAALVQKEADRAGAVAKKLKIV